MTMNTQQKPAVTLSEMDVITPPVRLAFPSLFEQKPRAPGSDRMTYQATALIPPEVDLTPFKKAIVAAMRDKWGDKVKQLAPDKNPLKDCATKADLAGYIEGWRFINLHSGYQPQVVDRNRQPILTPESVYPGCWVRIHMKAFAYDHPVGGKGVSFSLEAVQFVRDDERFDGRRKAADIFDALGDEDGATASGGMDDIFG